MSDFPLFGEFQEGRDQVLTMTSLDPAVTVHYIWMKFKILAIFVILGKLLGLSGT